MKESHMPELISGDAEDWKFYDRLDYVDINSVISQPGKITDDNAKRGDLNGA